MGGYTAAARRRVHLATVLLRPPSSHRPGRRQAGHARILQKGLRLAIRIKELISTDPSALCNLRHGIYTAIQLHKPKMKKCTEISINVSMLNNINTNLSLQKVKTLVLIFFSIVNGRAGWNQYRDAQMPI